MSYKAVGLSSNGLLLFIDLTINKQLFKPPQIDLYVNRLILGINTNN